MTSTVQIIAEAEINHNGDVEIAKSLVNAAVDCGADSIKFQCFAAKSFIAPGVASRDIFIDNELSNADFREISAHAQEKGIDMLATAGDIHGLNIIMDLDLPAVKLGSTNITNTPLLEAVSETGKPVYLSTGASTLGEIETALDILCRGSQSVSLFHCTVQYPASAEQLNLRAIPTMMAAFPGIPVGYSDHTKNYHAAIAAVTLGATILEKHFTLDNDMPGPDHAFSSNPVDLKAYVAAARETEIMLGSARKQPIPEEQAARIGGRRYITALKDLDAGCVIDPDMIGCQRVNSSNTAPDKLLPPSQLDQVIGCRTTSAIPVGRVVTWDNLQKIS
jgi:N,N'-diacetyllegionaminate synthase